MHTRDSLNFSKTKILHYCQTAWIQFFYSYLQLYFSHIRVALRVSTLPLIWQCILMKSNIPVQNTFKHITFIQYFSHITLQKTVFWHLVLCAIKIHILNSILKRLCSFYKVINNITELTQTVHITLAT